MGKCGCNHTIMLELQAQKSPLKGTMPGDASNLVEHVFFDEGSDDLFMKFNRA